MSQKILILRFSSIGDIILTTPVIRCCREQLPDAEIHFVCKSVFKPILTANPYIHKLHSFNTDINELYASLKAEKFDVVLDLHRNLRSLRLKRVLAVPSHSFNKLNVTKLLSVILKKSSLLPEQHIVDRYFEPAEKLGVKNDGKGLDYFIPKEDQTLSAGGTLPPRFVVLVLGGSYFTKKIPFNKLQEICRLCPLPLVLVGGKEDREMADVLVTNYPSLLDFCGKLTINQSAYLISKSDWVITPDTGMMHVAAAFQKKIISVWGNTIPEFGMGPYKPSAENRILEVKELSCRPCSKLGYHRCPKAHFKCMNQIDYTFLKEIS